MLHRYLAALLCAWFLWGRQDAPPNSSPTTPTTENTATAAPEGVTAEPNPALPGQTVTFRRPDGAKRVVVSGGGLGRITDVTQRAVVTTAPWKTATYKFDLWFPMKSEEPTTAKRRRVPMFHRQETVLVHVYDGQFPRLATYHDTRGWHIDCVAGWRRYVTPFEDPANNALVFFEPQEDTAERLAVAIVPVDAETKSADLMHQVLQDAPTQYDVIKDIFQKETTQGGLPATWITFRGLDRALPDVPVQAYALAFIRGKRGYVISGRTKIELLPKRERLLRCLIRSFAFEPKARQPAPAGVHPPKR
jgi:hypothetical protein